MSSESVTFDLTGSFEVSIGEEMYLYTEGFCACFCWPFARDVIVSMIHLTLCPKQFSQQQFNFNFTSVETPYDNNHDPLNA